MACILKLGDFVKPFSGPSANRLIDQRLFFFQHFFLGEAEAPGDDGHASMTPHDHIAGRRRQKCASSWHSKVALLS